MDLIGMTPTVYRFASTQQYAREAAQFIERIIIDALSKKPTIRIALSGGSSPLPVYRELAKSTEIKWHRISIFLVDERIVPLNSNDSNFKNISSALIDHLKNLRAFYHLNTREAVGKLVHQYDGLLHQQGSPLFDLVILGLGEDGHTASLFPKSEALHEEKRLVLPTVNPHHHAPDRITITFPAILDSDHIVFLVQGKSKADVLERLLNGSDDIEALPAKKILEHHAITIYFDAS